MSTDVQWYGDGFSGEKRHQIIHKRLFNLLSKYGNPRDDGIVYDWMTHGLGWKMVSEIEECIFASLAKAIPTANFDYRTSFVYENGGLDNMYHTIQYVDGNLMLRTVHEFEVYDESDDDDENYEKEDVEENEDEADDWDEEEGSWHVEKDTTSLSCKIDKTGTVVEDDKLSKKCLEYEKSCLSKILDYIGTETFNPSTLRDLGMLYETGLAGIERNLTAAWDCYLKAAVSGYKEGIEFVKEIFADENKEELHELLTNKRISKESFDRFFELALEDHNAELTAELLEYKASLK